MTTNGQPNPSPTGGCFGLVLALAALLVIGAGMWWIA
jgi:hypothetical protein